MAGAMTHTSDRCTCGAPGECRRCAAVLQEAAAAELACCVCRDVTVHSLHVCHNGHLVCAACLERTPGERRCAVCRDSGLVRLRLAERLSRALLPTAVSGRLVCCRAPGAPSSLRERYEGLWRAACEGRPLSPRARILVLAEKQPPAQRGDASLHFGAPAVDGDQGEKTWRDESGQPRSKRARVVRVSDCGRHCVTETAEQTTASENGVLLSRAFKQGALAGLTKVLRADGVTAAETRWEDPSPRAGEVVRYGRDGEPDLRIFTQGARRGEMHEYSPGERTVVYMGPHAKEGERHHFGRGADGQEELRQVSFLAGHPRCGERRHFYREASGDLHLCSTFEFAHAAAGRRVFFDEQGGTLAVYSPGARCARRRWAEQHRHAGCRNSAECRERGQTSGRVLCTFCCQLLL